MTSPIRSTALRAGLVQVGAGIVVLLLLASALWWVTVGRLNNQLKELVGEDTRTISALIQDNGQDVAIQDIERHVGPGLDEDEILLLTDPSFHRLAGNLPAWPIDAPQKPGWSVITISRGGRFSQARVLHTIMPGGDHLLSGRDLHARDALEAEFEAGLVGAVLIMLAGW